MKLNGLALAIAACRVVDAHSLFTTLFVNDINQGDGTCVRMPRDPGTSTNPVIDLASKNMVCGVDGDNLVDRVCSVPQSAKLSFLFRTWPDGSQEGSIDPSHKGPCAVYMKAQRFAGEWFNIWDEGYDQSTSQWCSEKIIKNNGFLSVKIPGDLLNTYYLVRVELLALHEADKNPPQPQFYIGCAQIYFNSTGTSLPSDTVKIPGHVSLKDPGVLYNVYDLRQPSYRLPGPKIYASSVSPFITVNRQKPQEDGLLPGNVVLTNANWWGLEVPVYNDEKGCQKTSDSCFRQLDKCYENAPPTGSNGCRIWEAKCLQIAENCNSPHPSGPLNAGKLLGIPGKMYSIPPAQDVDTSVATQTVPSSPMTIMQPALTSTSPALTRAASPTRGPSLLAAAGHLPTTHFSPVLLKTTGANTPPTSSTTSQKLTSAYQPSKNNRCGELHNFTTCFGSPYGKCCSSHGYCGNTASYCGSMKCQPGFGECGDWLAEPSNPIVNRSLVERITSRYKNGRKRKARRVRMLKRWRRRLGVY